MKKFCWLMVICLLLASFAACASVQSGTEQTGNQTETTATPTTGAATVPDDTDQVPSHQELTATEATIDTAFLRISIPEVGLENVRICDASHNEVYIERAVHAQVYLLGDDWRGDGVMVDHYLAIRIGEQVIVKDLVAYDGHFNLGGSIATCDVDGDGYDEILVQQTVAMSGGMGAYLSRVFDYKNGELIEIFSSDDFFDKVGRDTGFSITLMEDQKFRIDNAITGYSEVFRLEDRNPEYFNYWYNTNGEVSQREIIVDSFYAFVPIDIDDDGVCEISCRQYVSLCFHNDGIGCAKTILKYNTETASFEIISASFDLEY